MNTKFFGYELKQTGQLLEQARNYFGVVLLSVLPRRLRDKLEVGDEQLLLFVTREALRLEEKSLANVRVWNEYGFTSVVSGTASNTTNFTAKSVLLDAETLTRLKRQWSADKQFIVGLSPQLVFRRTVPLPLVAKDNYRQVIAYQLDRYTPFPKDSIYYDVFIKEESATQLYVELVLLQKEAVQSLLNQLAEQRCLPDILCVGERAEDFSDQRLNLLPAERRRRQARWSLKAFGLKPVWLCLLLLGIFAIPLTMKRLEAIQLEKALNEFRAQADGELALWEQRNDREELVTSFIHSRPVPFAAVLEELTKRLPDDAWVSELNYKAPRLSIRGQSANAPELVSQLEASPYFANVVFEAPLVKENYKIGMNLIGEITEAPTESVAPNGAGKP